MQIVSNISIDGDSLFISNMGRMFANRRVILGYVQVGDPINRAMSLNVCAPLHTWPKAYMDVTECFSDDSTAKRSCRRACWISVLVAQMCSTRGLRDCGSPMEKPHSGSRPSAFCASWIRTGTGKSVLKKVAKAEMGLEVVLQSSVERRRSFSPERKRLPGTWRATIIWSVL